MSWPPSTLRVRIYNQRRRFGLWLPLFLVWPLIMAFVLLLYPLVLVCAAIFWFRGWGKPLLLSGPALFGLFCALYGLRVEVNQPSQQVLISFR